MSAAGSYAPSNVDDPSASPSRRRTPARSGTPGEPVEPAATDADPGRAGDDAARPHGIDRVDLTGLSIAGITRRRVGWVSGALVAVWIVIVFTRQVGDAQAAANRATQLADDNVALAAEVAALQKELAVIVRPEYVAQQARAYRFGGPREIPFTLSPAVADPVDGAPGSASVRLGATTDRRSPLEVWLSLLFGPRG
jgi:cell division protein FtsB